MEQKNRTIYTTGVLALLAVLFVSLSILSSVLLKGVRFDMTGNGLYTLRPGTLNILENMEEPVTLRLYFSEDVSRDLPQFRSYARWVGEMLEEFADRMPSELSGGQRRRVAVARAMAHEPELILYDEATTGLDPITASNICDLMIKLRDLEGVTTVFVTHQLRDAFQVARSFVEVKNGEIAYRRTNDDACLMGTEFMMLNRGEMVFRGRLEELQESSHPYVKTFMA